MNPLVYLVVFATPIAVSAGIALWQWWQPRHRLRVIFKQCRRERCAVNVLRFRAPVSQPAVSGVAGSRGAA